jgi:hypothetical protein
MEDDRQLSLRQLLQHTELTMATCQRIVRKDLEDSVTADMYWKNILEVFSSINSTKMVQGYFQQDAARETLRYLWQFFDDKLINFL